MGGRKDLASNRQLSMIEETDYLDEGQGHSEKIGKHLYQNGLYNEINQHTNPLTTVDEVDVSNSKSTPSRHLGEGLSTNNISILNSVSGSSKFHTTHEEDTDENQDVNKSVDNYSLCRINYYFHEKSISCKSILNTSQRNGNYFNDDNCNNNNTLSEIDENAELGREKNVKSDTDNFVTNTHQLCNDKTGNQAQIQSKDLTSLTPTTLCNVDNKIDINDNGNDTNNNIHEMFQVLIKSIDGTNKEKTPTVMELEDVTKIKSLLYQTDERIEKQPIALNDIISTFKEKFSMPNAKRMTMPVRQRSRRNLELARTGSSESDKDKREISEYKTNLISSGGSFDSQVGCMKSNYDDDNNNNSNSESCIWVDGKEKIKASSLEEGKDYREFATVTKERDSVSIESDIYVTTFDVSANLISNELGSDEGDDEDTGCKNIEKVQGVICDKSGTGDLTNISGDVEDIVNSVKCSQLRTCVEEISIKSQTNGNRLEIASDDTNGELCFDNTECSKEVILSVDKNYHVSCGEKNTLSEKRKNYLDKGRQKYVENDMLDKDEMSKEIDLDITTQEAINGTECSQSMRKAFEKDVDNQRTESDVLKAFVSENCREENVGSKNEIGDSCTLVCSFIVPEIRREGPKYYDDDENYVHFDYGKNNDNYVDNNDDADGGDGGGDNGGSIGVFCENITHNIIDSHGNSGQRRNITVANNQISFIETFGKSGNNKIRSLSPKNSSNTSITSSLLNVPKFQAEEARPSQITKLSNQHQTSAATKQNHGNKTFLSVPQSDNTNNVAKQTTSFLNPNGSIAKKPMLRHVSQPNLTAHHQPKINNSTPPNQSNELGSPVSKFQSEDLNSDLAKLKATAVRLNLATRRPSYLKWLEDRKTNWPPLGTMPLGNSSTSKLLSEKSVTLSSATNKTSGLSDSAAQKSPKVEECPRSQSYKMIKSIPKVSVNSSQNNNDCCGDDDNDNDKETVDNDDDDGVVVGSGNAGDGNINTIKDVFGDDLKHCRKVDPLGRQRKRTNIEVEVRNLARDDIKSREIGGIDDGQLSAIRTVRALYPWSRHRCQQGDRDRLTPDRKKRIEKSLEWLQKELKSMRNQDQQLARQLLSLRQEIHSLKYSMSYQEHRDHMEDVQCDLEDLQEFSNVLDLPSTLYLDTPLKNIGVTRWNITARRFSTC